MLRSNRVVQAIERNPEQFWRLIAENCEGSAFESRHGVSLVSVPYRHPLFNSALTADVPAGTEDAAIEGAQQFFGERSMPWNWIVGPITRPADLASHLVRSGFTHAHDTPGMARDLRGFEVGPTNGVAEVSDMASFAAWIEALLPAFNMPAPAAQPFVSLQEQTGFGHRRIRYFVAMDEGRPVATSMNYNGAGVTGIYCVGTVPEARRRGFAERVMHASMAAALEDGYDTAILHSSRMGVPLYEKLGFREYCKLAYYQPPAI